MYSFKWIENPVLLPLLLWWPESKNLIKEFKFDCTPLIWRLKFIHTKVQYWFHEILLSLGLGQRQHTGTRIGQYEHTIRHTNRRKYYSESDKVKDKPLASVMWTLLLLLIITEALPNVPEFSIKVIDVNGFSSVLFQAIITMSVSSTITLKLNYWPGAILSLSNS